VIWLISNSTAGQANAVGAEISGGTLGSNFLSPVPRVSIIAGLALSNLLYGVVMGVLVLVPLIGLSGLSSGWG